MKTLAFAALAMAALPLAAPVQAAEKTAQAAAPFPSYKDMRRQIVANDSRLFWGFFEGCDPDLAEDLLHPDFRMVHDKVGLAHDSAADMVSGSRAQCSKREPGGENAGYKNRRLLVPGSRIVRPLGDWGALEEGWHTFLEWRDSLNDGKGGWELTGGARYIHTWQWMPEEGRFRLLESISIDHGASLAYPPQG